MTGTGPDRPPLPVTAEDHAYFRALEEAFLRLRGKAALLSPSDWQVAQVWHRAGIPAELVVRVMEELFARARERAAKPGGRRRNLSSLTYFKAAVTAAWEEIATLSAGGRRDRLEPFDAGARLERLATSLDAALPEHRRWSGEIRALAPSASEVEVLEAHLAGIDARMLDELRRAQNAEEVEEERAAVAEALRPLAARLSPEELDRAREHLATRHLRARFRLPVLSLVSPEARTADGNGSEGPDSAS